MVHGGMGQYELYGARGPSWLYGRAGKDQLSDGTQGEYRMTGGRRADVIQGADGADVFLYTAHTDSGLGTQGDTLWNFGSVIDKNDVSALGTNLTWVTTGGFDGHAGQIRHATATGFLFIHLDGNGAADVRIILGDKAALMATDLLP